MKNKWIIILTIMIMALSLINADEVRTQSFKYYKDVVFEKKNEWAYYGVIHLDDEIFKYAYGYDLRLLYKGKSVPYFLTDSYSAQDALEAQPKVIYNKIEDKKRIYILQFPSVPDGAQYRELQLDVLRQDNYEIAVTLQTSNDLKSWENAGTQSLYQYADKNSNVLKLDLSKSLYLRLELKNTYELSFNKALYLPKKIEDYSETIPLEQLAFKKDRDQMATVYYFENEKRKKLDRLVLKFKEEKYERGFSIYRKDRKQYKHFMSGTLTSENEHEVTIKLTSNVNDPLKIIIKNGDNEPLQLEEFNIWGPKEMIVFTLPSGLTASASIRLYYGNRYIRSPSYDIRYTYDEKRSHQVFKLKGHTQNADFSYSIIEPPVSTWIIRILFILGLLGLLWPTYRVIKKYKEDVTEVQSTA